MDAGLVGNAHLPAHPLLVETLVLLVPEAIFFWDVGMLADTAEAATMLARVVFVVATATMGTRSCLGFVLLRGFMVCCRVAGVVACAAARLTCRGFTVGLGSVGGPVVVVIDGLLLEKGGEVGDLVGHAIGASKFAEDGGDTATGVGVVVGIGEAHGLKGRTEFSSPGFTGCELYVGKEDECELCVVDGNAVGVHAGDFGTEKFDVGDYLFLEVELEGEDGSKLLMDVARVGTVSSLDRCSDKVVEHVVIDAAVVSAVSGAEDCIGDIGANFVGDGLGGSLFSSDDGLIDLVDAVCFVLCISTSGDGREHRNLGS